MHKTNSNLPAGLRAIAPWIGATVALLIAVVILSRFIDTLHVSIQHGQDLRAGIHATATTDSNTDVHMADAGARQPATAR